MFLLAVAVDDMLMGITHVIRGDDLLASAPRNAAVIEALGGTPPAYAHLPQVLGADGKPLSKRHGSTSVEAFREQGFLPEALMNYLALLGWSKDAETTFLSKDELDRGVRPRRACRATRRAFDTQKLEWMNNHYIQQLDDDELAARCLHFLTRGGLSPGTGDCCARAMPLVRERMKTPDRVRRRCCGSCSPTTSSRTRRRARSSRRRPPGYLERVADALETLEPWDAEAIEAALDALGGRGGAEPDEGVRSRSAPR